MDNPLSPPPLFLMNCPLKKKLFAVLYFVFQILLSPSFFLCAFQWCVFLCLHDLFILFTSLSFFSLYLLLCLYFIDA